jgi:nondiscriminating aspartyl-tRNA synthetase
MNMETAMLQATMQLLAADYGQELERLGVCLPDVAAIPLVRFDEAKRQVQERYGRRSRNPNDLEPEEERLISEWVAAEYGSELVFITHYPSAKRPFYAMDDPQDPRVTLSFDLLYHGVEVTTGGQRIHDYQQQADKMRSRGLDPQDFASYLMIHEYGMPPHGGLGIGLERLLMALLRAGNIRQTALFPRDMKRLDP